MTGTFEFEQGDKRADRRLQRVLPLLRDLPLLQRRRLVPHADAPLGPDPRCQTDEWYQDTAKNVYRPDIYLKAAKLLVDEGKAKKEDFPWDTDGYQARRRNEFIDGVTYDGRAPNAYIDEQKIGIKGKQKVNGTEWRAADAVTALSAGSPALRKARPASRRIERLHDGHRRDFYDLAADEARSSAASAQYAARRREISERARLRLARAADQIAAGESLSHQLRSFGAASACR